MKRANGWDHLGIIYNKKNYHYNRFLKKKSWQILKDKYSSLLEP